MHAQVKKVFLISLDGATFDVLRPLMQQGYMPNLKKMVDTGLSAELESVVPPVTAPAWTSFMTGKNPNKHGIYDFMRFDPRDYTWHITNSQTIGSKTIWQIVSDKGKRVVVLSLPYTYPPYQVNGIMVSGWDCPSADSSFTYPEWVRGQILETFPDYRNNYWVDDLRPKESDEQFKLFLHRLTRGFEQGARLALQFLDSQKWDIFMVHFQQTDWIQHKLWGYIEQACKDPSDKSTNVERVRQCYQFFDSIAGMLLESVDSKQAVRVVLSDHGFGSFDGAICPNYFLRCWGYLHLDGKPRNTVAEVKDYLRNSENPLLRGTFQFASSAKGLFASHHGPKTHDSWQDAVDEYQPAERFDWTRTKVVSVLGSLRAFVFVNVKGRGLHGIVEPGEEYERVISDLIDRFKEVRHPRTGEQLLSGVTRGTEVYSSAPEGLFFPDLVLFPARGYGFSFATSGTPPEPTTSGIHRQKGVLVMDGDGVAPTKDGFRPRLIDLAPTLLHLLGLAVPSDMEGRVLDEILTDRSPVRHEEADNSITPQLQPGYTADEAVLIEERLKGLGYLE